ncbi:hypothetical protein CKO_04464 [Citrobacter koseri ATCC BAA-895]|uniref:Uncharacterized protein n=1 Tax=Citrobacter koseri (strain ATCC BAA-895 / CDC 4225-83 / SGSC4696) TaxID=290338 RepID=A8APV7_CITK8|nr:hypothetical protein CKO_04464 [Citrobacter koseri ATCC BAA-895]
MLPKGMRGLFSFMHWHIYKIIQDAAKRRLKDEVYKRGIWLDESHAYLSMTCWHAPTSSI